MRRIPCSHTPPVVQHLPSNSLLCSCCVFLFSSYFITMPPSCAVGLFLIAYLHFFS